MSAGGSVVSGERSGVPDDEFLAVLARLEAEEAIDGACTTNSPRPPQRRAAETLRSVIKAAKRTTGENLADLTVLSANIDPYRLDTPAGHRIAQWFAEQVERFVPGDRTIHLRGLHYRISSIRMVLKPGGIQEKQRYYALPIYAQAETEIDRANDEVREAHAALAATAAAAREVQRRWSSAINAAIEADPPSEPPVDTVEPNLAPAPESIFSTHDRYATATRKLIDRKRLAGEGGPSPGAVP